MSEVTLTFKCGIITSDGRIDPDGYKFFTWSYFTGDEGSEGPISHIPLAGRILSLYPDISQDSPYRIVYIDEDNDRIEIPCDNIRETLAALKVTVNGRLEEQSKPVRVFIQPLPPRVPSAGNCQGELHSNLHCSGCKKGPIKGFLYKCLQCPHDYNLCGQCDTAGKHREHVFLRYSSSQHTPWLNEMKQLVTRPAHHAQATHVMPTVITTEAPKAPKLATCTLRVLSPS